jgi:hypothetical protein
MKNKLEDFCYVCGEVVPEEVGLAEQVLRKPSDPGWGRTRYVVRHTTCQPPTPVAGNGTQQTINNVNGN